MPYGIEITYPWVSTPETTTPDVTLPTVSFAVDISLREKNGSNQIVFPWNPDSINYRSGEASVASHDILKKGPVDVPLGVGLKELEWQCFFPGRARANSMTLKGGSFKAPKEYVELIEYWKEKGTTLIVMVTNYPINFDCYVKDFNGEFTGGFGDIDYDIHLVEKKDVTIKVSKEDTQDGSSSSGNDTKRPPEKFETYIVVRGDTLWDIAQRFLGDGSRWEEIYQANKDALDQDAKAHGVSNGDHQALFPGITLTIVIKE